MNEQKVYCFNHGKMSVHNFSSPLTLIYSPVWFICPTKRQIQHFDWSVRLSIKLPTKGQLTSTLLQDRNILFLTIVNAISQSESNQTCRVTMTRNRLLPKTAGVWRKHKPPLFSDFKGLHVEASPNWNLLFLLSAGLLDPLQRAGHWLFWTVSDCGSSYCASKGSTGKSRHKDKSGQPLLGLLKIFLETV